MAQRHLVIERLPLRGEQSSTRVHVTVDDHTPIGPWIATLAVHLRYPLVDSFGTPIAYHVRSLSGENVLPRTGHFADVRFPSGSCFVLEPDAQRTVPLPENALPTSPRSSISRISRRSMVSGGILTSVSLLGLGSGITTAVAQRLLDWPRATSPRQQTPPGPVTLTTHTIFSQHQQIVRTISWAPDESAVASGGNDNLALLWKMDGTILHTLRFHAHVRAIAWSPDGMQVVAGAANAISFFAADTGMLLAENTEQHTAPVTSLGWTSTQTAAPLALSAGTDTRAIVWNGQTHQPLLIFRQHTTAIEALAVLAGTVATASQGGIARLWNAFSGQETHGYYSDSLHPLRAIAFSSRGSLAIGSDDGIVSLWNDGRTCLKQNQDTFGLHCVDEPIHVQAQSHPVRALAFSPDGTMLATGGDEKNLTIWSVQRRIPLLIQPQQDALAALSWSPSGKFLAGACGPRVVLWQIHR